MSGGGNSYRAALSYDCLEMKIAAAGGEGADINTESGRHRRI